LTLMVLQDNGFCFFSQLIRFMKQFVAQSRMPAHLIHFVVCEPAGFVDDVFADINFTDVMKKKTCAQCINIMIL